MTRTIQRLAGEEDVAHRVVERDGAVEHVVDLGPDAADATAEVVDGTVIVVADDEQYDIEVPGEDARAFMANGVLTVTMEDSE